MTLTSSGILLCRLRSLWANPYRRAAGYIDRILKGEKAADGAGPGMQILKFQVPSSRCRAKEFRACDHILDTYPTKTSAGSATADFTIPTPSPVF
jgi:hypothetical protein